MSHTVCSRCNISWLFHDEKLCKSCTDKQSAILFIIDTAKTGNDIESICDTICESMINSRIKLSDQEIKQVCDAYFNSGEKTGKRLEESNQLFSQLHHNNGMIA